MKNEKIYNLIIIGGGAAGMFSALSSVVYTNNILILDSNAELGKKIAATGNGKCNFTNSNQNKDFYRSNNPEIAYSIIKEFDYNDVLNKFKNIGIISRDRMGYYYPYSEQASSVKNVLINLINQYKITIKTNETATDISINNDIFKISTANNNYFAKKLIIACGGAAAPCFGTNGNMYALLKKLGHTIIKPEPALVGLLSSGKFLKTLAGVRFGAEIILHTNNRKYSEKGEIIFNKNGISGIPVMSLSRYADYSESCTLSLNFMPNIKKPDIKEYILDQISRNKGTIEAALTSLLNNKLLFVLLQESKIDPLQRTNTISEKQLNKLINNITNFTIPIIGNNGFENAQTTKGGVPLTEIYDTMESKIIPNLFFAGEILDVDGTCGGYNLHWAWASGAIAGAYGGGGYFDKDKFIKA